MKIIFLLIFSARYQSIYCQDYSFDYMLEYEDVKNGYSSFLLINQKNDSYILKTSEGSQDIYGTIRDSKNDISHEYDLKNVDTDLQFNYLYSRKYNAHTKNTFFFEISEVDIDSTKKEVRILVYKNEKRNKLLRKIEVILDLSVEFAFEKIMNYYTHGTFANSTLKISKGIPLILKVDYMNGFTYELKLVKKQIINTVLSISKKQMKFIK